MGRIFKIAITALFFCIIFFVSTNIVFSARITSDTLELGKSGTVTVSTLQASQDINFNPNGEMGVKQSSPHSTFQVEGSEASAYELITGTDTLDSSNYFVAVDPAASTTVNLPTASGIEGRIYIIKAVDVDQTITVDPSGAETIDGNATISFSTAGETLAIISDGTNWKKLVSVTSSVAVDYVQTEGATDPVVYSANIDCDASSTVSNETGSWIASIGNISSGKCLITLDANIFSAAPNCAASDMENNSKLFSFNGTTSSTIHITGFTSSTGSTTADFDASVVCHGIK